MLGVMAGLVEKDPSTQKGYKLQVWKKPMDEASLIWIWANNRKYKSGLHLRHLGLTPIFAPKVPQRFMVHAASMLMSRSHTICIWSSTTTHFEEIGFSGYMTWFLFNTVSCRYFARVHPLLRVGRRVVFLHL